MTQLNSKQGQTLINSYLNTKKGDSIFKAYKKPSTAKIYAFNNIKNEMSEVGGYGLRVTHAGSHYFSVAYLLNEDNKKWLIYHTRTKCFKISYEV